MAEILYARIARNHPCKGQIIIRFISGILAYKIYCVIRIVLLGYIVKGPLGGLVWHHLQYVLGLKLMGHEVLFLEYSENYEACYNPSTNSMTADPTYGLSFINRVFKDFNLQNDWCYIDQHTETYYGKSNSEYKAFVEQADLLINLSAIGQLNDLLLKIPERVFLDTDPLFTQIRILADNAVRDNAQAHTQFFTFAENINHESCSIPKAGLQWKTTRQPMVLSAWPVIAGNQSNPYSTVMQWDSYKEVEWRGQNFGMKSREFKAIEELPSLSKENFVLALGSATAPKARLLELGWKLEDPLEITKDHRSYQAFIQDAKGELTVAKHGYVATNSGWFSERSAAYLASGRPVITQETGFSKHIDLGPGLHGFSNQNEILVAIERINANYVKACDSARQLAEENFDHGHVLSALLNQL